MVAVTDTYLFANNASATLNNPVAPGDTTLVLGSGQGALFPTPAAGQYFAVTIHNVQTGLLEICYCTGRSGDLLTVERGREGTSASSWPVTNCVVQMRVTKGILEKIIQRRFTGSDAGKYLKVLSSGEVIPDIPSLDDGTTPGTNYVFGTDNAGDRKWVEFPFAIRGAAFQSNVELANTIAPVSVFCPDAATIRRVVITGDVQGSVLFDIKKQPLFAYTGETTGTSICSGDPPGITNDYKSDRTVFTGWDLEVDAGDVLNISIVGVSNFKRLVIRLYMETHLQ